MLLSSVDCEIQTWVLHVLLLYNTALWLRVGGQNVAASRLQLSLCEANTLLPPGMCEESQIKACSCLLSPDNVRQTVCKIYCKCR